MPTYPHSNHDRTEVPSTRRRRAAAGLMLLALLGSAGLAAFAVSTGAAETAAETEEFRVEPSEIAAMLHRLGLTPDALAAAGVDDQGTATVFSALAFYAQTNPSAWNAVGAWTQRRNIALANLSRPPGQRAAAPGTSEPPDLAQASGSLDGWLDTLFSQATAPLGVAAADTLAMIRANSARWNLPAPYLVAERQDHEWFALRAALASRRTAARLGRQLENIHAQLLAEVEAEQAVAQALGRHATNIEAVRSAWNGLVSPED